MSEGIGTRTRQSESVLKFKGGVLPFDLLTLT